MKRTLPIAACAALVAAAALLSSCSTQMTYMPDGRVGYTVDCSASYESWADCFGRAGKACGPMGYDIFSKDTDRRQQIYANADADSAHVDGGSYANRSLVVACRR